MYNSTLSTSNNPYSFDKKEDKPKKDESKPKLIIPSFINSKPINFLNNFSSNISDKNNYISEPFNSFASIKSQQDFENTNQKLFPSHISNYMQLRPSFPISSFGLNNSKIISNNFLLNYYSEENEDFYKNKIENKIYPNLFNYNNKVFNRNINPNMNNINDESKINPIKKLGSPKKNENINISTGTKFFTNHNYGYRCSCSKTQCNRKYCECFNSGNYCVDCNCKNCNNKPPVNTYSNKRPIDEKSKSKKVKIICTCTKSGCNKNYCECFKAGQKCSDLCRCISCENNDQILNKKLNNNYQCNLVNSIYIIKNKIYIEDIKDITMKKIEEICKGDSFNLKHEFIGINKKRKREEENNNINEEKTNKIKKMENLQNLGEYNDSLFDKNGKVILRHINLFQI